MLRLDHINLHARRPAEMIAFLEAIAGVKEGFRPPFPNRGHWLYLDGAPVIHLDAVDDGVDRPKGIFDHVAFGIFDRDEALRRVVATGLPHVLAEIPGTDIGQIFVTGPEGLKVELQFRK